MTGVIRAWHICRELDQVDKEEEESGANVNVNLCTTMQKFSNHFAATNTALKKFVTLKRVAEALTEYYDADCREFKGCRVPSSACILKYSN